MSTLSTADVAYCAAIIDNLATLRARRYGPSLLPIVEVSGRWASLSWLADVTGTTLVETRRAYTRHNCTEHCPDRHANITSRSARWSVTGMRATIVLAACLPYMRERLEFARQLVEDGLGMQYQGQVVNDMAARGWPIPDLAEHTRARVPLAVAR